MMLLFASMVVFAVTALSSQDISAAGPFVALRGTWTKAADAKAPVVLIIPGSGPTDRDGNSPLGVNASSYRLLSEGLGSKGISTVRVDKRGMYGSADAVPDANAVTINNYVSDTRTWVKAIRSATGTDCVWLLGPSEGGLVVLSTAQEEPHICGLILVATPGRPFGDILKEQLRNNPVKAPLLSSADAAIDTLAAGKHVDNTELPAALTPLFDSAIQDFLISAFSINPGELAKHIAKPILILQGERDLQISVEDALALKAAAPSAKLVRLPDANHVLKAVPSNDAEANITTYTDPGLPLASGIIEAISDFVRSTEDKHQR